MVIEIEKKNSYCFTNGWLINENSKHRFKFFHFIAETVKSILQTTHSVRYSHT